MRKVLFALLALAALVTVPVSGARIETSDAATKRYVVVFNAPSGLPAGAEKAVAASGGTVVVATPQIGALLAESSNPNFESEVSANPQVRAVSENAEVSIPEALDAEVVEPADADNNGGNASPPGEDPQLGSEP